jgi:hypothetical protein
MSPDPAIPAAAVSTERRDRLNDVWSECDAIDALLETVRAVATADVSVEIYAGCRPSGRMGTWPRVC